MSWQILIWNMFIWTCTSVVIYVNSASLWWLMLPAFFTGTQSATELVKAVNEAEEKKTDEPDAEELERISKEYLKNIKRGKAP